METTRVFIPEHFTSIYKRGFTKEIEKLEQTGWRYLDENSMYITFFKQDKQDFMENYLFTRAGTITGTLDAVAAMDKADAAWKILNA